MPVPADVSGGLLEYTNSLRSSAVHAYTDRSDKPSTGTITAGELTYCQAVLWITPLLAAIEKANNQLAGIRQIEQKRQETNDERANGLTLLQRSGIGSISGSGRYKSIRAYFQKNCMMLSQPKASETTEK